MRAIVGGGDVGSKGHPTLFAKVMCGFSIFLLDTLRLFFSVTLTKLTKNRTSHEIAVEHTKGKTHNRPANSNEAVLNTSSSTTAAGERVQHSRAA